MTPREPDGYDADSNRFDLSLRFFGNEIFGFRLRSDSTAKNWAFFAIMAMFAVAALVSAFGPTVVELTTASTAIPAR